ncbi:AT-rich interactive domain-containing protein 3A-like [Solea senegalensis]|uniref:AT-rich interactive domain-containing protein 3 n=1 Tax=Solea senegalensis TaxID=28829 RepID=A0AAV6QGV0_SOLSE|nr:AT-rich interactive domain-containing protein 3A [Solea senegalensis]KAG7489358.1 AT-rich interactive domain-containing protein 3A-like [Solea senegalensis]
MVDNTSIATKSALQGSFSSGSLPLQAPSSASSHSSIAFPGSLTQQAGSGGGGGGGGMKLEAVMENLQRQQAARLALEEKLRQAEKEKDLRPLVESHIHQQALAFRHYQAAMRGALAAGVTHASPGGLTLPHMEVRRVDGDRDSSRPDSDKERTDTEEQEILDDEEDDMEGEEEEEEEDVGLNHYQHRLSSLQGAGHSPKSAPMHLMARLPAAFAPARRAAESPPAQLQSQSQRHEWTYEEQFKQLYELDDDEKRKEFLDDLFSFMQKRGTPVNRIPIMAKQVLDLYMLYKLVTEKGGLVEVINKKIWREITKGLNLPTSITSAAFTLRTQYMKYLYPYECAKRGLSSPGELQAAIDSNRREGRRQSYGSAIFNYSPVGTPTLLSSPKMQMSHLPTLTHNSGHMAQVPVIKKEDSMMAGCLPSRVALPMSPSGHHGSAVAAQAAQAAQAAAAMQAAALEQLREKLESGEPPEKKMMMMAEEQHRIMQHALQQNLLAMATQLPLNIKLNNRDDRQETALNLSTNGISSINMSIEINGVVYTGVLFARQSPIAAMMGHRGKHSSYQTQGKTSPAQFQPSCSSSSSASSSSSSLHGHRNPSP